MSGSRVCLFILRQGLVTQAGLELALVELIEDDFELLILLPLRPEFWGYWQVIVTLSAVLGIKPWDSCVPGKRAANGALSQPCWVCD